MASERQVKANRANCKTSTGPKSPAGKSRAARNARRHGLSVPIMSDPQLSADAEVLAREIEGENASAEMQALSRIIAEAQIDLLRIRDARRNMVEYAFGNPILLPTS